MFEENSSVGLCIAEEWYNCQFYCTTIGIKSQIQYSYAKLLQFIQGYTGSNICYFYAVCNGYRIQQITNVIS